MADNNPAETYRLAYKELLQETNQVQSRIGKLEEIASLLSGRAWQKITFSTGGGQVIGIGMRKVTTKPVLFLICQRQTIFIRESPSGRESMTIVNSCTQTFRRKISRRFRRQVMSTTKR